MTAKNREEFKRGGGIFLAGQNIYPWIDKERINAYVKITHNIGTVKHQPILVFHVQGVHQKLCFFFTIRCNPSPPYSRAAQLME